MENGNRNYFQKFSMPTVEEIPVKRKSRAVSSFLKKTYEILGDEENHYAVKWASDGVGFIVVKQDLFSKEVLPKYFKHSNYSSFVRQLNMYNFHKIRQANYESHFHHESFRRDDKSRLSEIRRKPEKKKRKNDEQDSEVRSDVSMKHRLNKGMEQVSSESSQDNIKIKSYNSTEKKGFQNTRHLCKSEKENNQSKQRVSIQNLLQEQNEEDKISINNELGEIFPRYPTKQIFCESNNNIYPFAYRGGPISHFNIFY